MDKLYKLLDITKYLDNKQINRINYESYMLNHPNFITITNYKPTSVFESTIKSVMFQKKE